jgi:hypothetical protein
MMEQAHNPDPLITERYFLGELTNDEAEAFEAHYFDCPRCAGYVVEELALFRSGRDIAKEAPPNVVPFSRRLQRQWLAAAAAAMLVVAVGVPMMRRQNVDPSVDLVEPRRVEVSTDRAAAEPMVFRAGEPVPLYFEIPPEDYPRFAVTIRDHQNRTVDKGVERTAEQTAEPVFLVLSALPAGTYNVVIEGVQGDGNRSTIATRPFEVRE